MLTTEYDTTKTFSGLPAPSNWHVIERREDGLMWERLTGEPIRVIESTVVHDGKTWLHVSVSKAPKKKMPTYDDVQTMRTLFVGDRESYMIFPPSNRYANVMPVLHLFCCLDAPEGVLPHFEGTVLLGGVPTTSV